MKTNYIISSISALLLSVSAGTGVLSAQDSIYFVDGFHGGVYGHYPMQTYTDYMSGLLEKYPDWRMCLEIEPETWDTVAVRTPEAYRRFAAWTESDRVEFTNPSYAQPYMYNISGESIIRQLGYGMRKINGHFPSVEFSTYAVEEPCFTSALPQILKQYGFKYASLKCPNTCWGGYSAAHGGELVNWTGPDGTSILTSPRYACEELEDSSVWQTTAWGNEDRYIEACREYGIKNIVGMCYQDAGWTYGPWIGYGDSVMNNSVYVTWREYFEKKADRRSAEDYIFSQEDVRPALMWGSQVLQTIAQQVRRTETLLVQAEKSGVLAYLQDGFRYDQSMMDEAWRTLMLAQHHDSWIVPYNRLNSKGTWADNIALWTASSDQICTGIIDQARASSGCVPQVLVEDGKFYVKVFNTLGFAREEIVTVPLPDALCGAVRVEGPDGVQVASVLDLSAGESALTFAAEVPAFGYATYAVEPVKAGKARKAGCTVVSGDGAETCTSGEVVVENSMYRLTFDASHGGVIRSLVVKDMDKKEYADKASAYGINELRGYFYDEGVFRSSADSPAKVTVCGNGLVKTVTVEGTIASSPFVQTVTLKEGDRKIDFSLSIDWKSDPGIGKYAQRDAYANRNRAFYDDRFKLNVLFPVSLDSPQLYKDAPFDVCKSALEDTFYETWDNIKHNVVLHWIDLAGNAGDPSLALLSDHTTSYSYGPDFPLGLTVQFSGNGLWGRDYRIKYPTRMRYALVPHEGEWDKAGVQQESLAWNEPLEGRFAEASGVTSASYIDLDGTGYEISTAMMTDGGMLLRLFNASGDASPCSVKLGFGADDIKEVDLRGNVTGSPEVKTGNGVTEFEVSMPRFGVRTYLVSMK